MTGSIRIFLGVGNLVIPALRVDFSQTFIKEEEYIEREVVAQPIRIKPVHS